MLSRRIQTPQEGTEEMSRWPVLAKWHEFAAGGERRSVRRLQMQLMCM
jgi:hypothetical protein